MNEQALEFLRQFGDWIKDADMFSYMGYYLLWGFIKGLYYIASFCEGLVGQIFILSDFLEVGTIGTVYKSMKTLSLTVLALTLIFIAFKFMFNIKVNIKGALLRSIIFGCLITWFPSLLNTSVDLAQRAYEDTKQIETSDSTKLSFNIIKDNLADMIYLADKNFVPLEKDEMKNDLTEELFLNTDLTEVLTPKDINDLPGEKAQYLKYKTRASNGALEAKEIENGWFSMFDEGKFRFTARFGTMTIGLITLSLAFIFSTFIIGTSFIDLAFAKILFPLMAMSDIETGQRVKNVLIDIGKNLLQIILTGLSLSIFSVYFSFISTKDLNIVAYTIACIIGIKVCIDGSKAFEKYLGIDVGVRSGYQTLVGTAAALSTIGKVGKGVANTAKTGAELAKGGASLVKNGVGLASDVGKKSINGASKVPKLVQNGLENGAMALGEASGQISERGLGGFAKDTVNNAKQGIVDKAQDTKDSIKEKAEDTFENTKNAVTQPFKRIGDSYTSGREEGLVGAINKKSEDKAKLPEENNISQSPEKNFSSEGVAETNSSEGKSTGGKNEERAQVTNGVSNAPHLTYVGDRHANNPHVSNVDNQPSINEHDPNSIDIDSNEKYVSTGVGVNEGISVSENVSVGESRSGAGETIPRGLNLDDYNNPLEQNKSTLGGNAQTVTQPTKDIGQASTTAINKPTRVANKNNNTSSGTTQQKPTKVENKNPSNSIRKENGSTANLRQTSTATNNTGTTKPIKVENKAIEEPIINEDVKAIKALESIKDLNLGEGTSNKATESPINSFNIDFDKIFNTDVSGNLDNLNDLKLFDD